MTSVKCTYCPYGHNVLEALSEIRPNIAWVAVHSSGMGPDKFVTDESDDISNFQCSGYPSASFNRMYIDDQNLNSYGTLAVNIGYYPEYAQQAAQQFDDMLDEFDAEMPSFASVDIATKLDGNNLNIKVSGDAVEDFKQYVGDDAVVTVYSDWCQQQLRPQPRIARCCNRQCIRRSYQLDQRYHLPERVQRNTGQRVEF